MLCKPTSCATICIAVGTESCCWYVLYSCAVVSNITLCSQAQDSQQPSWSSRCVWLSHNLSQTSAPSWNRSLKLITFSEGHWSIFSLWWGHWKIFSHRPGHWNRIRAKRGHWSLIVGESVIETVFLIRAWNRRWSPSQWFGPLISTWILEHFFCVQGRDPHTWVHHTHLRPQKPTRSKMLEPVYSELLPGPSV